VAEGTSLLRMHTAYTCIVSSNLTVSAMHLGNIAKCCGKTRISHSESPGFFVSCIGPDLTSIRIPLLLRQKHVADVPPRPKPRFS
jgi:hypothetical protein